MLYPKKQINYKFIGFLMVYHGLSSLPLVPRRLFGASSSLSVNPQFPSRSRGRPRHSPPGTWEPTSSTRIAEKIEDFCPGWGWCFHHHFWVSNFSISWGLQFVRCLSKDKSVVCVYIYICRLQKQSKELDWQKLFKHWLIWGHMCFFLAPSTCTVTSWSSWQIGSPS